MPPLSRTQRAWLKAKSLHLGDRAFVAVEDDGVVHHVDDAGSDGIYVLACNHDRGAIPTINDQKVSCIHCLAMEKS